MPNTLMDALSYVGDSIDKPGRAVRGLLAGKAREGLAAIPFSDSLGLTDNHDNTSGRDLTDHYGLTSKHSKSFSSSALGFGAGILTDPMSLVGAGLAAKGAKTFAQGAKAVGKSLTGLDLLDTLKGGYGAIRGGHVSDDVIDSIRLDRPLKRSAGFSDIDHNGDRVPGYRSLKSGSKTLGNTYFGDPGAAEYESAARNFPGVVQESDSVRRVEGTYVDDQHQGKGLGQALYLDMMGQHPGDWFHNGNASNQANRAREALGRKGYIEHHIDHSPGGIAPYVGRITDAGLEALSHPDLLTSLMAGKGFPAPLPMPPRGHPSGVPMMGMPPKVQVHSGPGEDLLDRLIGTHRQPGPTTGMMGMDAGGTPASIGREIRRPHSIHSDPTDYPEVFEALLNDPKIRDRPWFRAHVIAAREGLPVRLGHPDLSPEAAAQFGFTGYGASPEISLNTYFGHSWDGPTPKFPGGFPPSVWTDRGKMDDLLREHVGRGWFAAAGPDGLIHHEVGHGLHARGKADADFLDMQDIALPGFEKDLLRAHVGEYAATNPLEAVAEIYAKSKARSSPMPRSIGRILEQYAGPHMLDKLSNKGLLKGVGLSALAAALMGHHDPNEG